MTSAYVPSVAEWQAVLALLREVAQSSHIISINTIIAADKAVYVPRYLEIASGITLEIGSGATLEIG